MYKRRKIMRMEIKPLVVMLFGVIVLLVPTTPLAGEEKGELEHRIITFTTYDGVRPTTLTSGPGTTVIWVNNSRSKVELLFLDKEVVPACGAPVNFFVGKGGAYESERIALGGTASLCFARKGKYSYLARYSPTFYPSSDRKEFQGVIWIQ
jgi:hypothetical protein